MQMWTEIRRRVLTGESSKRAICREYNIHWGTLKKILQHAEPPGYRQRAPRLRGSHGGTQEGASYGQEVGREAARVVIGNVILLKSRFSCT